MSLRPEELVRKIIAAGYGNVGNEDVVRGHEDDTFVTAVIEDAPRILGDWVCVSPASLVDGTLKARQCTGPDDQAGWLGVVQHSAAVGTFAKVKTCGVTIAKIDSGGTYTRGDTLHVKAGAIIAEKSTVNVCARYLQSFSDPDYAWVALNASGAAEIKIEHDLNANSTKFTDTSDGSAHDGYTWHLFRVRPTVFTGPEFGYRLMLAIGGHQMHGTVDLEGMCWGGLVSDRSKLGIGEIGGESGALQGVIGIEYEWGSDSDTKNRVNVRSLAGFNTWDRFGFYAWPQGIGPHRYAWDDGIRPVCEWDAPESCDQEGGGCPSTLVWWGGDTVWNPAHPPINTSTGWTGQFQPAIPCERDCVGVGSGAFTNPEFPCGIVENPSQFAANADDLKGAYEWVIPYGYTPCNGRMDVAHGVGAAATHIQVLWRTLALLSSVVDTRLKCLDQRITTVCNNITAAVICLNLLLGTKINGVGAIGNCDFVCPPVCCPPPANEKLHVPEVDVGPAGDSCGDSAC